MIDELYLLIAICIVVSVFITTQASSMISRGVQNPLAVFGPLLVIVASIIIIVICLIKIKLLKNNSDNMIVNSEIQTNKMKKSVDTKKIKQDIEAARMYDSNYKTGADEFCCIAQIEQDKWALSYFVKSEKINTDIFVTEQEAYEKLNDIIKKHLI